MNVGAPARGGFGRPDFHAKPGILAVLNAWLLSDPSVICPHARVSYPEAGARFMYEQSTHTNLAGLQRKNFVERVEQERARAHQLMAELLKATVDTMDVHRRLAARFELMANNTRAARKARCIAANIAKRARIIGEWLQTEA